MVDNYMPKRQPHAEGVSRELQCCSTQAKLISSWWKFPQLKCAVQPRMVQFSRGAFNLAEMVCESKFECGRFKGEMKHFLSLLFTIYRPGSSCSMNVKSTCD